MEILSGTKIGSRTAKLGDGHVDVDIIYETDEYGYAKMPSGDMRKLSGDQYKEQVAKYKRELDVKNTIDPDDFELEPERTPVENELVTQPTRAEQEKKAKTKKEKPAKEKPEKGEADANGGEKKKFLIPILILVIIAIIAVGFLAYSKLFKRSGNTAGGNTLPPAETTSAIDASGETSEAVTYEIAVLKHDVELGATVSASDFEAKTITEDAYVILAGTTYVDGSGNQYTGTVLLYNDLSQIEGKVALRKLEADRGLTVEDFGNPDEEITGQVQVRMVAIVSSETLDEDIVLELGQYILTSGAIEDVLNSNGKSVLPGNK